LIEFHGDKLVPPELCTLLYHAVPKSAHVPVRFFNWHDAYGERRQEKSRGYSTPFGTFMPGKRPWIGINLNAIYFKAADYHHPRLAPSTAVWRTLLEVCLHEFGHSATREIIERMNRHEYETGWGRVYRRTEQLAEDWKDLHLGRILTYDPRLGQPRCITGYLSALLARRRVELRKQISQSDGANERPSVRASYFKEQRCWKAGAQLTSGDVLRELGLDPRLYPNSYGVLRRASGDVGVDYLDGAGRRHKLYAWGDVPLLRERMQDRLDELVFRPEPADPCKYWVSEHGRTIVSPDGSEPVWSEGNAEWGDPDEVPF
jgi:hypothetical protein